MFRLMQGWDKDHKIPRISPGLIFLRKAFLLGLFSGELIFGGAYHWREFGISKWIENDNKSSLKLKHEDNRLKQLTLTVHGLIFVFERAYYQKDICVSDLGGLFSVGLVFGGVYYRNFSV